MRILCIIGLAFFIAWCVLLAPEAWYAARLVWTSNEGIVIAKSKVILGLYFYGLFGIWLAASGLLLWRKGSKL